MWLEYIMWIFWYGIIALFIFATLVIGCCIIATMVYGMCSLMEYLNKKGYHG